MKLKVPSVSTSMVLVGAVAMAADTALYVAGGSNGDAPDAAKVVLTVVASAQAYSPNIRIFAERVLEPGHIQAEAPIRQIIVRSPSKLA